MSGVLSHPLIEFNPGSVSSTADDEIRAAVWGLLTVLYPRGRSIERRRELRYPYPHLVVLTPVNGSGTEQIGEPVVVAGRHLSERGLGFFHPAPLPYRRVIATLEANEGKQVAFLLDLNWCRFTRRGWYESGGRFLQTVPPPGDGMLSVEANAPTRLPA